MAENQWGNTPTDLRAKLDRHGLHTPEDITPDIDLVKLLGEADAQALREELGRDPVCL